MKIEILGTGCKNCEQLYENAAAAIAQFEASADICLEKTGDVTVFARKGVLMTPGLLIDDAVVSMGKVLTADQIRDKIRERLEK